MRTVHGALRLEMLPTLAAVESTEFVLSVEGYADGCFVSAKDAFKLSGEWLALDAAQSVCYVLVLVGGAAVPSWGRLACAPTSCVYPVRVSKAWSMIGKWHAYHDLDLVMEDV